MRAVSFMLRSLAAATLAFALSSTQAGLGGGAAAQGTGGIRVTAVYDIRFNGVSIGEFRLNSSMSNREYALTADARISLLAGMLFEWRGITKSSGQVTVGGPRPGVYSFSYKAGEKQEQIYLRFSQNAVSQISLNPPRSSSAKRIPITQAHLQNVVDPLSAVVLLSHARTERQKAAACDRKLPIFDGKARYDLIFSAKGTKRIDEGNGYKGIVYICRVKYVPIAGHKPGKKDDENELAAASENIEVWLMPVPEADLFVPYFISVPTAAGRASMSTTKFEIQLPSQAKKTLVN